MKQNSPTHPTPICDELCPSLFEERGGMELATSGVSPKQETRNKKQETGKMNKK
jgi:hypothetical protein